MVTVIVERPGAIEVYRPRDARDVLTWHGQQPSGTAVWDPDQAVWAVRSGDHTLWCKERTVAWHALVTAQLPDGR